MKFHNLLFMLTMTSLLSMTKYDVFESFGMEYSALVNPIVKKLEEQPQTPETESEVHFVFAGDLCLEEDEFVIDKYDETGVLEDCISPEIVQLTNAADIFFLNHEYTCTTLGEPLANKYYTFRAKPERMEILKELGTDIVSLANNHVYDYGPEAMLDTMENLKKAGITYVGGGANFEEASRPVYTVKDDITVGYVAASRAEKYRLTPQATEHSPGIFRMYELQDLKKTLIEANNNCDFLIAYIHWGTENSPYYEEYQREIAKEIFACGADIIIGGHPHVLQGMEYIDGKPVIYSMGDFWFNDETKYTGLLDFKITKNAIKELKFIPCIQSGFKTTYIKEQAEQMELFSYLQGLSSGVRIDEEGRIQERD